LAGKDGAKKSPEIRKLNFLAGKDGAKICQSVKFKNHFRLKFSD
jgi:hypothetical protein